MTNDKERMIYIYNPQQANFYMSKGIILKETGINPRTKKVWYKFGYNATLEAYSEWCDRKH